MYLGPGYYAMDVSNPTYPVLVNGPFIYPYGMDVAVSGNLAYYVTWDGRLDVYDIASCADILVFADGFDSGETTWWSSTAGDSRKTR